MQKITISGSNAILLIYLSIFIVQNYGVNSNILVKTKEKVCNIQEAICPPDNCCSDQICKEAESSYKCCEVPTGYSRQTFSDYIITKEGWGCSNCPKCGNVISISYTILDEQFFKIIDMFKRSIIL